MGCQKIKNGCPNAENRSQGLPIILTGDLNATPESDVIQHITDPANPNHLTHTRNIALETSGTPWTFHNFGKRPLAKREFIDYIFVSPTIKVLKHTVIPEKLNGQFISDHSVVTASIVID
jgi:endonuclease/exonuclease/phosphatase family metal-dependent hydrolase